MTRVNAEPGQVVILQLDHVGDLRRRFHEAYDEIVECSAFVNWRRIEAGHPPVLILSFSDWTGPVKSSGSLLHHRGGGGGMGRLSPEDRSPNPLSDQ